MSLERSETQELLAKRDSLEREIRKKILTDGDKKQLTECHRAKRTHLEAKRKENPEVAQVDSALREAKLHGMLPDHAEAEKLMERKYSLEKGFEDGWQATATGKRCEEVDNRIRHKGDAALAADPEFGRIQTQIKSLGLL